MYSKRSKSHVEENPEKYSEEQVALRAQAHREQVHKIIKQLEPLDKRFYRKLKMMRRESLPSKLQVTLVDSSSREQTADNTKSSTKGKEARASARAGKSRSNSKEREGGNESHRKSTGR